MFIGSIKPRKNHEKQWLAVCLLIISGLFITVLLTGNYADKIDVQGKIRINNALIVYAENAGVIDKVYHTVGDQVAKGELLFRVNNNSSNYSSHFELSTIQQKLEGLYNLIDIEKKNFVTYRRDKEKEIDNINEYISIIDSELNKLKLSLELIEKDIVIIKNKERRSNKLFGVGAISLDNYDNVVMELHQKLGDKNRINIEIDTKSKEIVNYKTNIDRIRSSVVEAETNYQRQLEALEDRKYSLEKNISYYVYAPTSGVLSYSNVNENQAINDGEQLGIISNPIDNEVFAELYTDSKAMSYLGLNKEVVIRVEAFPYEEFGVLKAHVLSVSPTKMMTPNSDSMFNVKVRILDFPDNINIKRSWLKDGMTVNATYSGPKLSLIEWLFLPIVKGIKRNPDFWRKNQ